MKSSCPKCHSAKCEVLNDQWLRCKNPKCRFVFPNNVTKKVE